MTVLPVLLAIREFLDRYQGVKLSEPAGGLGWSKATSLGGAENGRGGGRLGAELDWHVDLRLREGGESKVVSIIGAVGGGVVGVAGWRTIMGLGETSRGVGWCSLERLLGGFVASSSDMVRDTVRDYCQVLDTRAQGLRGHARVYPGCDQVWTSARSQISPVSLSEPEVLSTPEGTLEGERKEVLLARRTRLASRRILIEAWDDFRIRSASLVPDSLAWQLTDRLRSSTKSRNGGR